MMDIVDGLKTSAKLQAKELDTPEYRANHKHTIQWDAAVLIEKMRETNNALGLENATLQSQLSTLKAENEAALATIADLNHQIDGFREAFDTKNDAYILAREAAHSFKRERDELRALAKAVVEGIRKMQESVSLALNTEVEVDDSPSWQDLASLKRALDADVDALSARLEEGE